MDIINRLRDISKDSKYTNWYCSIILNSINRQEDVIGEKHHVIPRSLWKEGIKVKDNIVKLTYKEHFVCHKLLTLMLKNQEDVNKMSFALNMMSRMYVKKEAKLVGANEFKKIKESFLELNRNKTLKEMENIERKENFIAVGQKALKILRDKDTFLWMENSCNSEKAKSKKRETHKSESHREKCKQRELSKPKKERISQAKHAQKSLVEKLGGEDSYRLYLSLRIKGRKKYINPITKDKRVLREPLEGYILFTEYNKNNL
jgi:hypothetical protein